MTTRNEAMAAGLAVSLGKMGLKIVDVPGQGKGIFIRASTAPQLLQGTDYEGGDLIKSLRQNGTPGFVLERTARHQIGGLLEDGVTVSLDDAVSGFIGSVL